MSTLTVSPEYGALLKKIPSKVVRTEKENEACTEILYDLDRRSKTLTPAAKELAELPTLLIEDFEERRYQLPRANPHVRFDEGSGQRYGSASHGLPPRLLSSELLIKEPGHDVQSFFRLGQVIVIPKGVRQRVKDYEFGIHAGAQESAMQVRSAAE